MKAFQVLLLFLFFNCSMRVDWDNLNKPPIRTFTYDHPHDGNLTKAENSKNTGSISADGKGMYRIKNLDELVGNQANNCVSKTAKCMSNCNKNYDLNSSIFALKVAYLQAKRATCYDECYNELSPGCDYPLKRIKY